MQNPTEEDWLRVKRVFRYLKKTRDFGLRFTNSKSENQMEINAYSDSEYAECKSRKSRTGSMIMICGAPIIWLSKKQPIITLSTVESEYVAATSTAQEVIWITQFFKELGIKYHQPVLHVDNQGAIIIANDPKHQGRTKHIDVRYHYIREKIEKGFIRLQYCPTEYQLADILTKPLPRATFQKLAHLISVDANQNLNLTGVDSGGRVKAVAPRAKGIAVTALLTIKEKKH